MKKFAGLPALIFLSLVLFILPGCEKDPQIFEKPNILVEVSNLNPEFGGTAIVTWEVTGEYERITVSVNGEVKSTLPKSPDGGILIPDIVTKQIVSVSCWVSDSPEPILKTKEINPVVVIPNPPTMEHISVSPDILPIGGGICTINISASNVLQIFWSESWVEFNSPFQFSTNWISQDTSFTLILKGKGGEISQLISIKVEVPLTGQELIEAMLVFGPLRPVSSRKSYNADGGPWITRDIDYDSPCMNKIWEFSLDTKKVTYSLPPCDGSPSYVFTWDWILTGNTISGFGDREIVSISWNQMVWKELGYEDDNIPIWIETTFIHP